jgi:hypothetical protein
MRILIYQIIYITVISDLPVESCKIFLKDARAWKSLKKYSTDIIFACTCEQIFQIQYCIARVRKHPEFNISSKDE